MTVLVGMPASLCGQFEVQGRQALAGLQSWARDANQDSSDAFRIIHYNDFSNKSMVAEVTRKLIEDDRVDVLIGPYSSVLTSSSAAVAEAHGKLLWNQGGASDNVYCEGYSWIVGVLAPASRYLVGLLPLIRSSDCGASTVALVYASSGEFPKAVCSGVLNSANDLGFRIVLTEEFSAMSDNFAPIISKLKAAQPDVVVLVGRVRNDLQIARQLLASGFEAGVVVAVAAGIQAFGDDLKLLSEGFVAPSQWEAEVRYQPDFGPSATEVIASLQQNGQYLIDYPMAQAYAAGLVVQKCLLESGSADDGILREVAANTKFSIFSGDFEIDNKTGRQIGRETILVQWQHGRKVVVWPPTHARGTLIYPWR